MANLLASLTATADSMRAFETAMSVTSNNVANASTPGYVAQQVSLVSQPLQLDQGLPGGVRAEGLLSGRSGFLETSVRNQTSQSSAADERSTLLQSVEPVFNIADGSGVAGALDGFASAVSQWTVAPNDTPSRQAVLSAASSVAHAFQSTASSLQDASRGADTQIGASVTAINQLGSQLASLNQQIRSNAEAAKDPGIDAQLNSTLEQLSQYADFKVLPAGDGTVSVYLGGQTPLVLGNHPYSLSADFSGATPVLRNSSGQDVTSQITGGQLAAQVQFRTTFLPLVQSNLDQLAGAFADKVNAQLGTGLDAGGNTPTKQLFTYSATAGIAASLSVNTLTTDELAGASAGAPGGNGNALALSGLLNQPAIGNATFTQVFGNLAGDVGRAVSQAGDDQQTESQLLTQAQSVRDQSSKVSLDVEAANLVQFQRAYEASAKLFQTLDQMTQTLLGLIPTP